MIEKIARIIIVTKNNIIIELLYTSSIQTDIYIDQICIIGTNEPRPTERETLKSDYRTPQFRPLNFFFFNFKRS